MTRHHAAQMISQTASPPASARFCLKESAARVARFCVQHHKLVSCENPSRSFMWSTSFWKKHTTDLNLHESVFDHCCYGGLRPKETRLARNAPAFLLLNLRCPSESSTHRHAPWGRTRNNTFATAEETAYPILLAQEHGAVHHSRALVTRFSTAAQLFSSRLHRPSPLRTDLRGAAASRQEDRTTCPRIQTRGWAETPTPLLAGAQA